MSIRQLEKDVKRVDRKLLINRRIIRHYFQNTMVPFFKQLTSLEIIAGTLFIFCVMRKRIKYLLPFLVTVSKRMVLSRYLNTSFLLGTRILGKIKE